MLHAGFVAVLDQWRNDYRVLANEYASRPHQLCLIDGNPILHCLGIVRMWVNKSMNKASYIEFTFLRPPVGFCTHPGPSLPQLSKVPSTVHVTGNQNDLTKDALRSLLQPEKNQVGTTPLGQNCLFYFFSVFMISVVILRHLCLHMDSKASLLLLLWLTVRGWKA